VRFCYFNVNKRKLFDEICNLVDEINDLYDFYNFYVLSEAVPSTFKKALLLQAGAAKVVLRR